MNDKRLKYEYHLGADSAGERVVRIIGKNKRVLELGLDRKIKSWKVGNE